MRFIYGRQDMADLSRAQENCFLMGNGLGGYASLSLAFSMARCDHGLLVSARTVPNDRISLVGRLQEELITSRGTAYLSTQDFDDGTAEDGYTRLSHATVDDLAAWCYDAHGVQVSRTVAMACDADATMIDEGMGNITCGMSAVAVRYTVENRSGAPCTLRVRPMFTGCEKSSVMLKPWKMTLEGSAVMTNGHAVYIASDESGLIRENLQYIMQAYRHDAPDGRPARGLAASLCRLEITVQPGEKRELHIVFSDAPCPFSSEQIFGLRILRMANLRKRAGLTDPLAQQLVCAADAFVADRASTGGKTILAGYPFFGDWGRDTMIALPGCTLSTGRYDDAKSILRTFLAYEQDGLVPNLFPEGGNEPMYNTVDAALLLVNMVHQYAEKTSDQAFVAEAWPVLKRIIAAYKAGTKHGIYMDEDGLIAAGQGLDQVTWMDVRIGDILPTPRHGKPVEINAYWYSALRIMAKYAPMMGEEGAAYDALADQVKESFIRAFWRADGQGLRDVISGTAADEQIRCNQIWAVTMPYTMLSREQERAVVDTVYRHLYTPCGLRTLSPEDPQYHGVYTGQQKERDLAYHQGTVWPFPLGAYYMAYLKVNDDSAHAKACVRYALQAIEPALREGCVGQLPEIYDGDAPAKSKGCFAQAWSVGEILRVFEAVERD